MATPLAGRKVRGTVGQVYTKEALKLLRAGATVTVGAFSKSAESSRNSATMKNVAIFLIYLSL